MKSTTKKLGILLTLIFVGALAVVVYSKSKEEVIEKNVSVLEGTQRKVSMNSTDVENLKIVNDDCISVTVKDFYVTVKGKSVGDAVITFGIPGEDYTYKIHVKVLSSQKISQIAERKIKQYEIRQKSGTKYFYYDFNQDGIEELCLQDRIVYYDYQKESLKTLKHDFKEIYVSKKNKKIYVLFCHPKERDCFVYFSAIYEPSGTDVFKLIDTGTGFRSYTKKGFKEYGTDKPYAYYDDQYDQDDYDYEDMTEIEMKQRLKQMIPGLKQVTWKIHK